MKQIDAKTLKHLKDLSYASLLELATEEGINASGKADVFSCIFGRDSAITILKILKACTNPNLSGSREKEELLAITKRSLLTLVTLQGKSVNIESGEEPGKFIHEYRKDNYERLLTFQPIPWYIYPDKTIKNYDSIDATPLVLIAIYRYWEQTHDREFLFSILPAVEKGLTWIMKYGDIDKDFLLEYELPKKRKAGGLAVQSWTDSYESLLDKSGHFPSYPIAPVEVQGYAWLTLKMWADFYKETTFENVKTTSYSKKLSDFAAKMKNAFNEKFLFEDKGLTFVAQALDGHKIQRQIVTGNALLLLWATYVKGGKKETILKDTSIPDIVKRSFMPDMFEEDAGVRTMSTLSPTYNPEKNSYHNGSFWPKLNGMAHEGLIYWGFNKEAKRLFFATLAPLAYFNSMVELYIKTREGGFVSYLGPDGQESSRIQAWSAASALELLTL